MTRASAVAPAASGAAGRPPSASRRTAARAAATSWQPGRVAGVARRNTDPTLLEVAEQNLLSAGASRPRAALEAMRACTHLVQYAIVVGENGGTPPPTAADYQHYWKLSERTAFRELSRIRAAFPAHEVEELGVALAAAAGRQRLQQSTTAAATLPASALGLVAAA